MGAFGRSATLSSRPCRLNPSYRQHPLAGSMNVSLDAHEFLITTGHVSISPSGGAV
jgi:hypothetical protein